MDIQSAWIPSLVSKSDQFILKAFIEKGYPTYVLKVLNNIRVYMKVVVLSDMGKRNGTRIANWVLISEVNINYK